MLFQLIRIGLKYAFLAQPDLIDQRIYITDQFKIFFFLYRIPGKIIHTINIDACHIRESMIFLQSFPFQYKHSGINDPADGMVKIIIPAIIHKPASSGEFFVCQTAEPIEILPQHTDVDIIIPGNPASMADHTKQCPPLGKIPDMMYITNRPDSL